jgi:predicted nuclease of predicted toxin-antitoxin system
LYFDHHVPVAIARGLRRRDIEVIRAEDDGTKEYRDEALLARATESSCVLVTNDEDFTVIAATWRAAARNFSGIAYMTRQHIPVGKMVEDLQLIAEVYSPEEMVNRIEYLPL